MAGPTIRENPLTTRRFQARAIGRDPGISGQGIMASGPWKGRINRSKTWPHPNSAAATQTELANGAPSRQGGELTLLLPASAAASNAEAALQNILQENRPHDPTRDERLLTEIYESNALSHERVR